MAGPMPAKTFRFANAMSVVCEDDDEVLVSKFSQFHKSWQGCTPDTS